MANALYNTAKEEIAEQGSIDLVADTIETMFVTSSYVFDPDHDFVEEGVDDANEHEVTGTGYTGGPAGAGRHAINTSGAWSTDKTNNRAEFDADDPTTWTAIDGFTIDAIIVLKRGPTNDTDAKLIAYIDTASGSPSLPFTANGSDFTININAEGLINLT